MKSIIAFLIIGIINPLIAADWPNWLGPNSNGISSEEKWDPDKIGNVIWKSKVGIGFSGVAVAAGRNFTLGHCG